MATPPVTEPLFSGSVARARSEPRRLSPRAVVARPRPQQRGRTDHVGAEALADPVHRPRQPLAAHRVRIEEVELPGLRRTERGRGEADETDALHEALAREEDHDAAVKLEAVLGGVAGVAARDRLEVGEAQLQRDARGGHT